MIRSLRLINYRCFEDTGDVPLSMFAVLIGQNDGGKSSALVAIKKFFSGELFEDADHRQHIFTAEEEPGGREEEMTLTFAIEGPILSGTAKLSRKLGQPSAYSLTALDVADERMQGDINRHTKPALVDLAREYGLKIGASELKEVFVNGLSEVKGALERVQCERQLTIAELKLAYVVTAYDEVAAAADPKNAISQVASEYYKLNHKAEVQEKTEALRADIQTGINAHLAQLAIELREHCPDIDQVVAPIQTGSFSNISFDEIEVKMADGAPVDWARFGKGKKREMSLSIFRRQGAILTSALEKGAEEGNARFIIALFDEPDINLDYPAQRRISASLTRLAAFPQCQVIAATHSANLIDCVPIDQVIFFGDSVPEPTRRIWQFLPGTNDVELTRVMLASVGLSNTALFNEKVFVVCSGETEVASIRVLYPQLLKRGLELDGVVILDGKNDEQAYRITRILRENGKRPILVIDRDAVEGSKAVKPFKGKHLANDLALCPEDVQIMGTQELEDCFSDEVWAACLNAFDKATAEDGSRKDWTPEDILTMRSSDKFSDALLRDCGTHLSEPVTKPVLGALVTKKAIELNLVPDSLKQLVVYLGSISRVAEEAE